jgi:hypothetical protein
VRYEQPWAARRTVRDTPGFVTGYHVPSSENQGVSIVVVEDAAGGEGVRAALDRRPANESSSTQAMSSFFEAQPIQALVTGLLAEQKLPGRARDVPIRLLWNVRESCDRSAAGFCFVRREGLSSSGASGMREPRPSQRQGVLVPAALAKTGKRPSPLRQTAGFAITPAWSPHSA